MNLSEGQKNCLLNVINVLDHISNEDYITKCWNKDMIILLSEGELSEDHVCNTIAFNCREALNILEDNHFYELVETEGGFGVWQELALLLNNRTMKSLVNVCKKIFLFLENGDTDQSGEELMKNLYWLNVVEYSKVALVDILEDVNVNRSDYLL